MKTQFTFLLSLFLMTSAQAKEIALTFDDIPGPDTAYFSSSARTDELIQKLNQLKVPPVMIFANPCKGESIKKTLVQIKKYHTAGHLIANHTCTHPRLDDVGFKFYTEDTQKADQSLTGLLAEPKFFRYPYLNESKDPKLRDEVRLWLKKNKYRNGFVTADNDDYLFSSKMNKARELGKKIDYKKIEKLFVQHIVSAADFYDQLARETLGYSPKHVLLLHEKDSTVMSIEALVQGLRASGWKIISAQEAYQDPIYLEQPQNTYANNGLIAQLAFEKTGQRKGHPGDLEKELDELLGLSNSNAK